MKEKILKKTREFLREIQKENETSEYGRPIPDCGWKEISEEHSEIAKELRFLRLFFITNVILDIIFISTYLFF